MPVYEFRCSNCSRRVERFFKPGFLESDMICPHCHTGTLERIMSSFSYRRSETDILRDIDTSRPQNADYYRDERNVGMWAKKKLMESGCDPGPEFDGIVEKARQKVKYELSK
jgi:putative FmdB family regulatory protein